MPLLTSFPFSQGGIPKATVTGTTGSPTIDTTSRPGKTIYSFTGSGSITFGQAGTCEVLVVGGGGGGFNTGGGNFFGNGGGGGGGVVYNATAYVPSSTLTVTVGAGGSDSNYGNPSSLAVSTSPIVFALPGGSRPLSTLFGNYGASSAGQIGTPATNTALAVTTVPFTQGNTGGKRNAASTDGGGCGGGGAFAVGADSTSNNGSNGGSGLNNSITGSSVTYGGGGGGGGGWSGGVGIGGTGGLGGGGNGGNGNTSNGTAGTANTGGGGGGGGANWSGGAGGSGIVIVVVG